MGLTYSMCVKKQEFDLHVSELEGESPRSTQPATPDILTTMKKPTIKKFSEAWCLSTRSTVPESLIDMNEVESEHIKDHYSFGKILSLNEYCIVREGYDKTYPSHKVIISTIEWQKVRNYHQSILDHIKALKEAEHANIANLVKVFVEHDALMLSAYPERLKKELKVC